MKTRFTLITILLALSIVLSACASASPTQPPEIEEAEQSEEVAQEEVPVESEPEPTEEPTEEPAPEAVTLRVGAKCGPTAHVMPLFVVLSQKGNEFDGLNIEYVPVTGPDQMTALLSNGEVDILLSQIITPAKMYMAEIPIRLYSISMTKGFYLVAGEDISSWEDLKGQRILMPNPASGPSQLAFASMKEAGFDPEADFAIENMPSSQIIQLMVAGEAPAAVISEPQVTIVINKSKNQSDISYKPAIDLYSVYESDLWEAGQLPLDGVSVVQNILDDEASTQALKTFVSAYNESIKFMLANPEEASKLIGAQLSEHCDSKINPMALQKTFDSGRLLYDPRPVVEFLPDIDSYIELVLGTEVDEGFYVQE